MGWWSTSMRSRSVGFRIRRTTAATMVGQRCWFSSMQQSSVLRVAIVGDGVAAWSAAWHIFVASQSQKKRISLDVYSGSNDCSNHHHHDVPTTGVGVWSPGLMALPNRVAQRLMDPNRSSTWVASVGYRRPHTGEWWVTSELPAPKQSSSMEDEDSLLFLLESDLRETLRNAVLEIMQSNDNEKNNNSTNANATVRVIPGRVTGLGPLPMGDDATATTTTTTAAAAHRRRTIEWTPTTNEEDATKIPTKSPVHNISEHAYDCIVAADGCDSAWPTEFRRQPEHSKTIIQEQGYTVLRGLTPHDDAWSFHANDNDDILRAFQTWGTGYSMRFANVPMKLPLSSASSANGDNDNSQQQRQQYHHAWFATVANDVLPHEVFGNNIETARSNNKNNILQDQKDWLLQHFGDWHDPIPALIAGTPHLRVDRARIRKPPSVQSQHNNRNGTIIIPVGDAYATVDPLLAQGFAVALEQSTAAATAVDAAMGPPATRADSRIRARVNRLNLVTQAIHALGPSAGAPTAATRLGHAVFLDGLVPIIPQSIKRAIFDAIMRYSLGPR